LVRNRHTEPEHGDWGLLDLLDLALELVFRLAHAVLLVLGELCVPAALLECLSLEGDRGQPKGCRANVLAVTSEVIWCRLLGNPSRSGSTRLTIVSLLSEVGLDTLTRRDCLGFGLQESC
jgi:hypothetical protein